MVLLVCNALVVYNMIIARSFLEQTIPDELLEAARMDGCSNTHFFVRIVLPLSKTMIAVVALYYAVQHWNQFMQALLYIDNPDWKHCSWCCVICSFRRRPCRSLCREMNRCIAAEACQRHAIRRHRGGSFAHDGCVSICAEALCKRRHDWRNKRIKKKKGERNMRKQFKKSGGRPYGGYTGSRPGSLWW